METDYPEHDTRRAVRIGRWVSVGFLAVAAFFLWTEHRAHLLGIVPYLIFLACPLMHLLHHHGHGHRRGDAAPAQGGARRAVDRSKLP